MKRYSLDLAPGVPIVVNAGGSFFYLDSGNDVQVDFLGPSNIERDEQIVGGVAGISVWPEKPFASVRVQSSIAQTVVFYIARGERGSINKMQGTISVLDASRGDGVVVLNQAFARAHQMAAAVANVVSQVLNPAASGRVVFVDKLSVSLGAGGGRTNNIIELYNVALINLVGNLYNKNAGGLASVAELRADPNSASGLGNQIVTRSVDSQGGDAVYEFSPAIRLEAGEGVISIHAQSAALFAWEIREVAA